MTAARFDGNTRKLFNLRAACRACSLSLIFAVLSAVTAAAETKNVRIMMDWIIQGTHAPFFVAQDKGYFKEQGVIVDAIDAGKGATNVAVSVAGGVYQFGWVDLPWMIRFNAANPASPLLAVYMSFDASPLAVITRKDAGIRKPVDLDGRKIAGGPAPRCTTPSPSCSRPPTPRTSRSTGWRCSRSCSGRCSSAARSTAPAASRIPTFRRRSSWLHPG